MHFECSACVLIFLDGTLVAKHFSSKLNIPYFVLTLFLGKVKFFLRAEVRLNRSTKLDRIQINSLFYSVINHTVCQGTDFSGEVTLCQGMDGEFVLVIKGQ